MRVAFNVGISLVISGIITVIQELSAAEQKAIDKTSEEVNNLKTEISALDDLKNQYLDIINSSKTYSEKEQELIKWKKDLVEQYKIEKKKLEEVNLERQTGIALINAESKASRERWYADNQAEIDKAVMLFDRKFSDVYNHFGYTVQTKKTPFDMTGQVRKEILDLFDETKTEIDKLTMSAYDYSSSIQSYFYGTNYEVYYKIENALNEITKIGYDKLTDAEKNYVKLLEANKKRLENEVFTDFDNQLKIYETNLNRINLNTAQDIFDTFLNDPNNSLSKVTEENFSSWKENLIALAGESEPVKEALETLINSIFPQYAEVEKEKIEAETITLKDKFDDLSASIDGVFDSFDTAFSKQSTIQSAFDKIQSGTDLTTSEMKQLIKLCSKEFPEIGTLFTKTAKGWTISSDDLIKANNALMKSTKDTIQQQLDGYNEIIRAYENRFVSIPKGGQTIQVATDIGITEEEYKNAKEQAENYKKILESLGLVLDSNTDKMEQFTKALKTLSTNISAGVSAQKEMNENGKISASTLESLLSLGEDYIKCVTVENGVIKFSADAFKEVTKAKLDDQIADLELSKAEAIRARIEDAMYNQGGRGKELQALIDETNLKLEAAKALRDGLDETWDKELEDKTKSKSDDPIKDAFQKRQKELEHLFNMEQITEAEYHKQLFDSKEYKALLADRTKYADELNSIDEKFYKFQQDKYKEDADKQFDALDEQFKAGKISAEAYAKALADLGNSLYGEGTLYAGTETAKKELESLDKKVKEVVDDIYSEFKEKLGDDGDLSLDNVLKDAEKLSKKNVKLFSDDPKTLKKNAEDIFSAVADSAKDALDKMLITPERYLEIIDEWGKKLEQTEGVIAKAKELSESDYLDAWDLENGYDSKKSADNFKLRAERIKYIFELAEQLYGKDGQDNVKAYNELIKQGLEDEQSLVEDYYDKEIEKLEKINDEEEKRQKAIELQMNLIKARQKLEDAKKQKNQLVFHNGTFEYMEDQDAVKSAQEDVLEAEKAILEQQVEDQKEALEERKKAVSEFFNKVEGDVGGALERIEKFISGDTSVYEKAPDKKDKDNSSDKLANRANSVINSIADLSEPNAFEKLISLFGGKPTNNSMKSFMDSFAATLIGKQIIPTTIRDAITNNSNTTNNTAKTEIHIDKIFETLNMPQGTTKEQVEEFFKSLNSAILQRIPQALIEVSK